MEFHIPISEVEYIIDEWVFNERNRKIAKRKIIDGVTFEKLAEEFELSPQQVKTIVYRCQRVILEHL